jgi:hypothetical protein
LTTVQPECIQEHRDPEFAVEEQKSQVIFLNDKLLLVQQIQVDGCVFTDTDGKRCDWLVNTSGTDTSVFVELKGSDIEGGFLQLAESQRKLDEIVKRNIIWIISYSGRPRFDTNAQSLILRARRDHRGAKLRVVSSPHRHTL